MKWYADRPARLARQVVADLVAVAWVWFWATLALAVGEAVRALRAPGDGLVDAGRGLTDTFGEAAAKARDVPLVGDRLAEALDRGKDAGGTLSDAGNTQIQAVETTAQWLTVALVAIPVAFLLITWLPLRLRFARRASAAARLRDQGRLDLLALHALNNLSLRELADFPQDPVEGWRRQDPEVVRALATRQLRASGVRA
ncbi:hypothetical protein [Saccharothrix longispora]|uniref:hypothetical protein n=1 Tax=Saccharothrix longispora TaxID=33920 RepID=UPI0028FD3089|nr:hypothetical protein [Saccharothrix longispora]MBY8849204.1 hypothetical protein [Saccharothrix sp. MB29]MDU0289068.1 hypothetical protein [Saccharothrix longispora]